MASARGRTITQWQAIKVRSGSRTWTALYQGRPSPVEGGILKREWWQYYATAPWVVRDDGSRWLPGRDFELAQSWDMTFKDTAGTDYVVGQVWMRRGADAFLLDQVRARMSFVETCHAVKVLSARWPQAAGKYIEDKANGPAVISALRRTVPGLIPVEPDGSKAARASAVSPFAEAGNVWLPDPTLAPWVDELVEECAGFPNAANDDQVDALSQALTRLLLMPYLAGVVFEDEDLDDELADYVAGGKW
jgi:predicted phage terminase large subunit-like protein